MLNKAYLYPTLHTHTQTQTRILEDYFCTDHFRLSISPTEEGVNFLVWKCTQRGMGFWLSNQRKMSIQSVPSQKDAKKMGEAEATRELREEERKFLVTLQMMEKVDLKVMKKKTSVYCFLRLRSQKTGLITSLLE